MAANQVHSGPCEGHVARRRAHNSTKVQGPPSLGPLRQNRTALGPLAGAGQVFPNPPCCTAPQRHQFEPGRHVGVYLPGRQAFNLTSWSNVSGVHDFVGKDIQPCFTFWPMQMKVRSWHVAQACTHALIYSKEHTSGLYITVDSAQV